MQQKDVSQTHSDILQGQRKIVYALDDNGEYKRVPSSGWEAEELVTQDANDWFDQQATEALSEYQRGQCSILKFHMFKRRMDAETLSQATGIWLWRVRRHLRAGGFEQLKSSLQQRYAEALGASVEQLLIIDSQ